MLAIAEISGADSIAAALAFAEANPGSQLIPTYVATGTEYGDFSHIEDNVAWLEKELPARGAELTGGLIRSSDPSLWRALNSSARIFIARFGSYLPCVGCHLYLHLMRIPIALKVGASIVISGERERHGDRTKANQTTAALDAYESLLAAVGLRLELPLRHMSDPAAVTSLLGPRWIGGSPQLECVLKGNEIGPDGSCVAELPEALIDSYVKPVGQAVARAMVDGRNDWDAIVKPYLLGQPGSDS